TVNSTFSNPLGRVCAQRSTRPVRSRLWGLRKIHARPRPCPRVGQDPRPPRCSTTQTERRALASVSTTYALAGSRGATLEATTRAHPPRVRPRRSGDERYLRPRRARPPPVGAVSAAAGPNLGRETLSPKNRPNARENEWFAEG